MTLLILWESDKRKLYRCWVTPDEALHVAESLSETERRVAIVHNGQVVYRGGYSCMPAVQTEVA